MRVMRYNRYLDFGNGSNKFGNHCSKLNNVSHLVQLQDFSSGFAFILYYHSINEMLLFHIILLLRLFFFAYEKLDLNEVITNALSLAQFCIWIWAVKKSSISFTYLFFYCLERKGSTENRNAIWKFITQVSRNTSKAKSCFRAVASAIRESMLNRSFAKQRWVDEFPIGTNATDWTIMQRVTSCSNSDWCDDNVVFILCGNCKRVDISRRSRIDIYYMVSEIGNGQ